MGQVTDTLTSYFQELYTSANLPPCEATTDSINQVINEEMNEQLSREFQAWEVQQAIKQMAPLKAPGPDGMPPLFFQQFWFTIGDEVAIAVLTCLNTGSIPPSINQTFITLIPKVKSLVRVSETAQLHFVIFSISLFLKF